MSELSHCPNDECFNEDLSLERTEDNYSYVYCDTCGMEGPVGEDRECAADVWNALPRVYDDEEDAAQTMATVVRMLSEKEYENKDLSKKVSQEEQVNENLRRILKEANDKLDEDLVAKCTRYEESIKHLQGELAIKTEHHDNQKAAWKKAHAEIMELRIKASDAETELSKVRCNHDDVLYVIDKSLSWNATPQKEEYRAGNVQALLAKMRDAKWRNNDPAENNNSHDTVLDEIMYRSSPYHKDHNQEVYDFAITCLGQTEVFTMELYGLVMEKYVQSSRMHQIAWIAAGRPGETQHSGRRPRT